MTKLYPTNFEDSLEVPALEDSDNMPVLIQNMSVIEDSISKCEKILQHLALGNYSREIDKYIQMHIQLISAKNKCYKKLKEIQKHE